MIAQVVFVLCLALSIMDAAPIDAYGQLISQNHLPAISYASSKVIAAPAISTSYAAAPAIVTHAAIAKIALPEPYDSNPQYRFSYGVKDHNTGDSKMQEETLVNGVVHGSYSLAEPDGSIRKVTYTADKINGFKAVVEKQAGTKSAIAIAAVPATVTKLQTFAKIGYAEPAISQIGYDAPAIAYGHHY